MITLHHVASSRSFRILWLMEEMGLDFEIKRYSITDGSLRDPAFLKKSPAGRVPALEVGEQVLFESGAIVQWLCETHGHAGLMPDPGGPGRVAFLEMLGFAETMASLIENLNLSHIFLRDPSQASPMLIKLTTARLAATLAGLEARLEGKSYLLGERFSATDTMMGFNLFAAPYYVKFDPYPALRAYVAGLEARPAFQRAKARDGEQAFYTKDFYPVPEVQA